MKNEDIYERINSEAVRNYLKEIGYPFNAAEAFFFIANCRTMNLYQKFDAAEELMRDFPDTHEARSGEFGARIKKEGLFALIKEWVGAGRETLSLFLDDREDGSFAYIPYRYKVRDAERGIEEEIKAENGAPGIFSNLDELFFALHEEVSDWNCELMDAHIAKKWINRDYAVEYRMDQNGMPMEELCVYAPPGIAEKRQYDPFASYLGEGLWFDFPLPFKKGDVLCNPRFGDAPFVLECTVREMIKTKRPNYIGSDNTDMGAWGYFIAKDGSVYRDNAECPAVDLEYYKGGFEGDYRTLKLLSDFIRYEGDPNRGVPWDLLIDAYEQYRLDHGLREAMRNSDLEFYFKHAALPHPPPLDESD